MLMMAGRVKRMAVLLPLSLAGLLFLLVLFADFWLESSTGRAELEAALARSLGMPVHLQGEFNITLLPSLGVSGTDLLLGDTGAARPFVSASSYHASMALLPLIDGKLSVLSFSVSGGLLDPARYRGVEASAPGGAKPKFKLPEVERLLLENFRIVLLDGSDSSVLVHKLELEKFRAGQGSPLIMEVSLQSSQTTIASLEARSMLLVGTDLRHFSLDIEEIRLQADRLALDGISGRLSWQVDQELLDAQLSWQDSGVGSASIAASLSTATSAGTMELRYIPQGLDEAVEAVLEFERGKTSINFPEFIVSFDQQKVTGSGCLKTEEETSLHLMMASDFIDADRLGSLLPGGAGTGSGTGSAFPLDLNVRLAVLEVHAAGAIALNTEISIGRQPDCN